LIHIVYIHFFIYNFLLKKILKIGYLKYKLYVINLISDLIGDWGLGIGDWGLGIGDWGQSPIPNPQSPIPKD
jgi:hypothetical protein